jgi:hypothetical protein
MAKRETRSFCDRGESHPIAIRQGMTAKLPEGSAHMVLDANRGDQERPSTDCPQLAVQVNVFAAPNGLIVQAYLEQRLLPITPRVSRVGPHRLSGAEPVTRVPGPEF